VAGGFQKLTFARLPIWANLITTLTVTSRPCWGNRTVFLTACERAVGYVHWRETKEGRGREGSDIWVDASNKDRFLMFVSCY